MIKETVIVRETHVKRGSRFVRKTKPNEKDDWYPKDQASKLDHFISPYSFLFE